jgi:HEAT repeats
VLEALDDIDWKSLGHAYGRAEDVPQQIRDLRSRSKEERDKASHELFSNIVHQGSRFEASAYTVPFLVEVAAAPDTQDRETVLALIGALAVGFDEQWLPGGVDIDAWRSDVASLDGEEAEWEQWLLNAYDAVRASLPTMRQILEDDNPKVRMWASYVLAWFPEDASTSLPLLLERARRETNSGAAAAAIVAVGLLGRSGDDELVDWLRDEAGSENRLRRWAAATALARLRPADLPPAAVDELRLTSSGDRPDLDAERFPFFEGDLPAYAAATLAGLPPQRS